MCRCKHPKKFDPEAFIVALLMFITVALLLACVGVFIFNSVRW